MKDADIPDKLANPPPLCLPNSQDYKNPAEKLEASYGDRCEQSPEHLTLNYSVMSGLASPFSAWPPSWDSGLVLGRTYLQGRSQS